MKRMLTALLFALALSIGPLWSQATQPQSTQQQSSQSADSGTKHHKSRHRAASTEKSATAPAGATAQCRDGSYSFSQHRRGTCSHHGGVAHWIQQ